MESWPNELAFRARECSGNRSEFVAFRRKCRRHFITASRCIAPNYVRSMPGVSVFLFSFLLAAFVGSVRLAASRRNYWSALRLIEFELRAFSETECRMSFSREGRAIRVLIAVVSLCWLRCFHVNFIPSNNTSFYERRTYETRIQPSNHSLSVISSLVTKHWTHLFFWGLLQLSALADNGIPLCKIKKRNEWITFADICIFWWKL